MPAREIPKPDELLALHSITSELFDVLRDWFGVPPSVVLDLSAVDSAVAELGDPQMIAALAMRKLQALNLLATPGVRTTTDVVVSIIQDLERAMIQAPRMRLQVRAAAVDWDAELLALDTDAAGPSHSGAADPEVDRFHDLHGGLHEALLAVLEASEGDIVVLV